ncbi:CdaR family protein [Romboutsia sedimentorum]|uniref:CdaR family protein n=1 Tax=Romboutsia sedimentorum TaxID=1368474 RepID=A0ABT7EBY0_9FIRM|nr:CdaR family protein [Romboutsia sedimentorum]MDK2564425.1 CdaR family protein [Romboutsia sedimentorum]
MIGKFKNNTKIKIISLLSALVLWLYVMEVVDPDETKLFENIPVTITNMNELKENDLVIYPNTEITSDINFSGKLSKLKKIKKENIHIDGQIKNPIEGKNEIYLTASAPGQITHDIKDNLQIVTLEKLVTEKKAVEIKVQDKSKIDQISKDKKNISVSGPRSLVKEVKNVVGILDVGSNTNDFSNQVSLMPVDKKGNEVVGVELEQSSIAVNVTLLEEKKVPIRIKFNEEINLKDYTLSQESVTIKGKKDIVDKTESIETQSVDINEVANGISKEIYLNLPEGLEAETKYITIKLNTINIIKENFEYTPQDIEIRNNESNIDTSTLKIPDNINVSIEYLENMGTIKKSDIVLYIDLKQEIGEGDKYDIKYDVKYNLKSIVVNPSKTE